MAKFGKIYTESAKLVDRAKLYDVNESLELIEANF